MVKKQTHFYKRTRAAAAPRSVQPGLRKLLEDCIIAILSWVTPLRTIAIKMAVELVGVGGGTSAPRGPDPLAPPLRGLWGPTSCSCLTACPTTPSAGCQHCSPSGAKLILIIFLKRLNAQQIYSNPPTILCWWFYVFLSFRLSLSLFFLFTLVCLTVEKEIKIGKYKKIK